MGYLGWLLEAVGYLGWPLEDTGWTVQTTIGNICILQAASSGFVLRVQLYMLSIVKWVSLPFTVLVCVVS